MKKTPSYCEVVFHKMTWAVVKLFLLYDLLCRWLHHLYSLLMTSGDVIQVPTHISNSCLFIQATAAFIRSNYSKTSLERTPTRRDWCETPSMIVLLMFTCLKRPLILCDQIPSLNRFHLNTVTSHTWMVVIVERFYCIFIYICICINKYYNKYMMFNINTLLSSIHSYQSCI